jgi:hypothetical protein
MEHMIQNLLLAALLLWSVWFSLRRMLPTWMRMMQSGLSAWAEQQGWPRLAAWLQPAAVSAGCGSGCNSCSTGCQTAKPLVSNPVEDDSPQVVVWRK